MQSKAVFVCVLCFLPGCIGIFRGSTQGVWLLSDPAGAKVTLDGQEGVTPCLKALDRGSNSVTVTFEKDGCASIAHDIVPHCDAQLLVLEFIWTIFGGLIDSASGAAYSWPYGLHATLAPAGGTSTIKETRALPKTPRQIAAEVAARKAAEEGRNP